MEDVEQGDGIGASAEAYVKGARGGIEQVLLLDVSADSLQNMLTRLGH